MTQWYANSADDASNDFDGTHGEAKASCLAHWGRAAGDGRVDRSDLHAELDTHMAGLAGAIVGFIGGAWVTFFHSNIRLHLSWAGPILNGPQMHRIHHSRLPQHHDRNFAAFFPVWDVLFGSYYAPGRDEFPPTGVEGEREVRSLGEAVVFPFREWRKMFREWRHRKLVSS